MLDLSKIKFPIYQLSKSAPILKRPPYSYIFQRGAYRLLDDSSKEGNLGVRRLKYLSDEKIVPKHTLARINTPIFRYSDIFQVLNRSNKFIDSSGRIFEYNKTTFYKIKYFKITKFAEIPTGYYIDVPTIHVRFYLNRIPALEDKYAGIIEIDRGYILYELSEHYMPDRRVKL